MDKSIAQNIELMPPPFTDGLTVWSRQNGVPGSANYANSNSAQIILTDPDFVECLEIVANTSPQKLRFMGQTPFTPGCYLRVSARVKVVSGVLPDLEIAGFPIGSNGSVVTGLVQKGESTAASQYDRVIEVSAIFGSGDRPGVDVVWGLEPVHAHFGLNIVGAANGASVRVESIRVEDVTSAFLRVSMDWVDVLDYGARGDGVFNNHAAFLAADAAANGREVLVPEGDFFIGTNIQLDSPFRFVGRVLQDEGEAFDLRYGLNYANYLDAFKDETKALKKALRTLFNFNDHDSLDLNGRQINLSEPLDVNAAVGNRTNFQTRRVIRNGKIVAETTGSWPRTTATSVGKYTSGSTVIRDVVNSSSVSVGALITGNGVGREVYVTNRTIGSQRVTTSQQLHGASSTQTYTFTRFSYLLDFSGFDNISNIVFDGVSLHGSGVASCILMPTDGFNWHFHDCWFERPRDRAITSPGTADFSMVIDQCDFTSDEGGIPASNRSTIAFNCNANDQKIRGNRGVRFKHFAVMGGVNAMFYDNHFFQGQSDNSSRTAGVIFGRSDATSHIRGNYIDNCWVEWTNEYTPGTPRFAMMNVDHNQCFASGVASSFSFVQIKPFDSGMDVEGMSVAGNSFKVSGTSISRADRVIGGAGSLSSTRTNLEAQGNIFRNVSTKVIQFP